MLLEAHFAYHLNILCHLATHPFESDKMAHHALFGVFKIFGKRFCNSSDCDANVIFHSTSDLFVIRRRLVVKLFVYFPCVFGR